jgi:hypothetical protein
VRDCGYADEAVFLDGTWQVVKSTGGATAQQSGMKDDKPIPAAYAR